ncbi:hypothetical protein AAC387_Pa02g1615 [Persea americana]
MMKSGGRQFPAIISSKNPTPSPNSDLPDRRNERKIYRRRSRNPSSSSGIRLRKDGLSSGKRSGPATPLLRWKYNDGDVSVDSCKEPESGKRSRRKVRNAGSFSVSARKLAAGLWHLQLPEASVGGQGLSKPSHQLGFESVAGHVGGPHLCNPNSTEYDLAMKDQSWSLLSVSHPKNGFKLEPAAKFINSAMERATKWDPECTETSDDVYRFYSHLKLLEDHQITSVSVISSLQAELEQSRSRIHELETERRSSKKKLEDFLRKLSEEKAAWRSREHEKMRSIIDDVKNDLKQERKKSQRLEIMNSKLVNELAEAKRSAKRFSQDYEKEWKARQLMEEVCDELAKEIGEDKAEVEALKRESMKIREEVEEERRMLQMAEVWREERVQMKLIEAKLILEDKYSQLSKLIADLESFLKSRSNTIDEVDLREAAVLREAASSVKIHDIKEFSYQPPTSKDILSVLEDLHGGDANGRGIEQCYGDSPASHTSRIHTVSPEINALDKNSGKRYMNGGAHRNGDIDEDGSDWETVSHGEEQGSSNSPEGSDPSVNGLCEESNVSGSGTEWEEVADDDMLNTEISETYSASARQARKKASSISRLWRSQPNNGEICKTISADVTNGRLSNGILSPDKGSRNGAFSPPSMGHWSSPESGNHHITRGMKGCIEWPRGTQKNSLKAKLLEARLESQKVQLRQVLKQKI